MFAVSQSGRTSFQDSGKSGGWTWSDSGNYGRYYDIYVDNVAPVNPGFSSVTVAGSNQVNLAWTIPLDQGVSIANSATEATTGIVSGGANGYVRGDVGVQVYRNGAVVSAWGTGTSLNDTGLAPNTLYTYTLEARDNNSGARGVWNNTTGPQGTNSAWTLSVPPGLGSVTPDQSSPPLSRSTVTWTAVGGFGAEEAPSLPPFLPGGTPDAAAAETPALEAAGLRFDNGLGGLIATAASYVIHLKADQTTPAPWCNVLANPDFGTLVTESGGGFTWAGNSGEHRLTPWTNDPVSDPSGEALYVRDEETADFWTPTPQPAGAGVAHQIRYGAGYARWRRSAMGCHRICSCSCRRTIP